MKLLPELIMMYFYMWKVWAMEFEWINATVQTLGTDTVGKPTFLVEFFTNAQTWKYWH